MRKQTPIFALAAIALLSACKPHQEGSSPSAENSNQEQGQQTYLSQSEVLANELKSKLGSRLQEAFAQGGGPGPAIAICQQMAQDITEATSKSKEKIHISRTALRVRNPLNLPDALSTEIMESWESTLASGGEISPVVTETEQGTIVHRPIMTGEICLQCHGSAAQVAPATLAKLQELYPADKATGFHSGDLRGSFRIEFHK